MKAIFPPLCPIAVLVRHDPTNPADWTVKMLLKGATGYFWKTPGDTRFGHFIPFDYYVEWKELPIEANAVPSQAPKFDGNYTNTEEGHRYNSSHRTSCKFGCCNSAP